MNLWKRFESWWWIKRHPVVIQNQANKPLSAESVSWARAMGERIAWEQSHNIPPCTINGDAGSWVRPSDIEPYRVWAARKLCPEVFTELQRQWDERCALHRRLLSELGAPHALPPPSCPVNDERE